MRFKGIVAGAVLAVAMAGTADATNLSIIGTASYSAGVGSYQVGDTDGIFDLVYDSDSKLIWLNFTHGWANWWDQNAWAAGLNTSITSTDYTFTLDPGYSINWTGEWRLPTADLQSYGFNITGSELGHLWYTELGNTGGIGNTMTNKGDLTNLQSGRYWSGTEFTAVQNMRSRAWVFVAVNGYQDYFYKDANDMLGLAVRSGQVEYEAAPVPEPSTMLLLGGGIAGLAFWKRRKS